MHWLYSQVQTYLQGNELIHLFIPSVVIDPVFLLLHTDGLLKLARCNEELHKFFHNYYLLLLIFPTNINRQIANFLNAFKTIIYVYIL